MPHCLLGLKCLAVRKLSSKILINRWISIEGVQKDKGVDQLQAHWRRERKGHDGRHVDRQRSIIKGARPRSSQRYLRKDKRSRRALWKGRSFRAFNSSLRPTLSIQKEC